MRRCPHARWRAKRLPELAAVLVAVSTCVLAQRIDAVVPLPDDFEYSTICWDPAAGKLYCGAQSGAVAVVDTTGWEVTSSLRTNEGLSSMVCDTNTGRVYAACIRGGGGVVDCIDGTSDTVIASVFVDGLASNLALDTRHRKLYCTGRDVGIAVIDTRTDTLVGKIRTGTFATLVVDVAGGRLFCGSYDPAWLLGHTDELTMDDITSSRMVSIIDTETDSLVARVPVQGEPSRLLFDPYHDRLYCVFTSGDSAAVIDCSTYAVVGHVAARLVRSASIDARSGRLCSLEGDTLTMRDAIADTVVTKLSIPGTPHALTQDSASGFIFVACRRPPHIAVVRDR